MDKTEVNMIERVSAAIMRAYFDRPIEIRGMNVSVADNSDLSRAAIAEMREPTSRMLRSDEGSASIIHPSCHMCGGHLEGWQAMIDQALKE